MLSGPGKSGSDSDKITNPRVGLKSLKYEAKITREAHWKTYNHFILSVLFAENSRHSVTRSLWNSKRTEWSLKQTAQQLDRGKLLLRSLRTESLDLIFKNKLHRSEFMRLCLPEIRNFVREVFVPFSSFPNDLIKFHINAYLCIACIDPTVGGFLCCVDLFIYLLDLINFVYFSMNFGSYCDFWFYWPDFVFVGSLWKVVVWSSVGCCFILNENGIDLVLYNNAL